MSADVSPVIEAADRLAGELPATALEALASVLEGAMVGAGLRDAVYAAISHSHYRALALKFIDVWRTIAPDVPAAGVALTLRTAAHCRTVSAEAQRLDLVWTGPDVPGAYRHTQPALLDLISRAKSRLTIVSFVAYKVPAVTTALADAARRGVDVRLILEDIEASQGKVASDALGSSTARVKGTANGPTLAIFPEALFLSTDVDGIVTDKTVAFGVGGAWTFNGAALTVDQQRYLDVSFWLWRCVFNRPPRRFRGGAGEEKKNIETVSTQTMHHPQMPEGHHLFTTGDPFDSGIDLNGFTPS